MTAPCTVCRREHPALLDCQFVARWYGATVGKYQLVRAIGAGAMGAVFEAVHPGVGGRKVVIKLIAPRHAQQGLRAEDIIRFMREAKAAGPLRSEHVVNVHDVDVASDGSPYLVMEYLDGFDCETMLERLGGQLMPYPRAVSLIVQACHGVSAAHACGTVHRDLKPSNLFLCRRSDGHDLVKVLDFGIAKLSRETWTGPLMTVAPIGTPLYASPEQARNDPDVDPRTDVYALGLILYEFLSGRSAFATCEWRGGPFPSLLMEPTPLASVRPGLPPQLYTIVHRAIAADRRLRTASADALREALLPYQQAIGDVSTTHGLTRAAAATRLASAADAWQAPSLPGTGRRLRIVDTSSTPISQRQLPAERAADGARSGWSSLLVALAFVGVALVSFIVTRRYLALRSPAYPRLGSEIHQRAVPALPRAARADPPTLRRL